MSGAPFEVRVVRIEHLHGKDVEERTAMEQLRSDTPT